MLPRDFWEMRPIDFHRRVQGYHIRYEKQAALFREVVAVLVNANRDTKVYPRAISSKELWPLSLDKKPDEKPAPLISGDAARAAIARHLKIQEEKKRQQIQKAQSTKPR